MGRVYQSQSNLVWPRPRTAEKGMTPSDMWAMFRLRREMAGAPGSDVASYERLMQQQILEKEKTEFEQNLKIVEGINKNYSDASDLASKEVWRNKALVFTGSLPPRQRQMFSMLTPRNPFDVLDSRKFEFMKNNPRPADPDPEWQEKAPGLWASRMNDIDKWKTKTAQALYGTEITTPILRIVNDKYYAKDGELIDKPLVDTTAKEKAKAYNQDPMYLLANDGYEKPRQIIKAVVDPKTNLIQEEIVNYSENVMWPEKPAKIERIALGESPGARQKYAERPPMRILGQADPVSALNAAYGNLALDPKFSPGTRQRFLEGRDAIEKFGDDIDALRNWTITKGSDGIDNYTLTVRSFEKELEIQKAPWADIIPFFPMTKMKNFYLIPVPGKPEQISLKDADIKLIVDREYGTVSTEDGLPLNQLFNTNNPDDLIKKINNLTFDEYTNYDTNRN